MIRKRKNLEIGGDTGDSGDRLVIIILLILILLIYYCLHRCLHYNSMWIQVVEASCNHPIDGVALASSSRPLFTVFSGDDVAVQWFNLTAYCPPGS
jgi:hypothetical protein